MAETLFRQWFVEEPKEGWQEKPLSGVANFRNGLACQKFPPESDLEKLPVLKIRELSSGISDASDWATSKVDSVYIVEAGDVIFSWSASLMVSINAVLKRSFVALGYGTEALVTQVSGALATIGQQLGNLRNEISPTSHGKSLEELKERNNKVDALTREFLVATTISVAVFLIRAYEERKDVDTASASVDSAESVIDYDGAENFNAFWDDAYGEFAMGDYSYPASEILFNMDYSAYEMEYKAYVAEQAGDKRRLAR